MAYNTQPYIDSIDRYRSVLDTALAIAQDPFKAPEQVVATTEAVMNACWNMQIEYSAMLRHNENER